MREVQAVQITAFRRDAQVKVFLKCSEVGRVNKRGKVVSFSDRSRSRLLFTAFNASCDWLAYAVLTYPSEFPSDGHKVKRDIDALCKWLRREYDAKLLWGIEFQKRGAPHINLLVDKYVPVGVLGMRWYEIVGSGDLKHLVSGVHIESADGGRNVAGYMAAAYSAKKSEQKIVPPGFENVGRFWGVSRGLVRPVKEEIFLIDEALPKVRALRRFTEKQVKARRCQPSRDDKLRLRKVKRKPSLRHLHAGLSGFKSFHGAPIAERLLGE